MSDKTGRAAKLAKAIAEGAVDDMAALKAAGENGTAEYEGEQLTAREIEERLKESIYGLEVTEEGYILTLAGGGPAARLTGELDGRHTPTTATVEYQDWFTPWIPYDATREQDAALLEFAQLFYFGE